MMCSQGSTYLMYGNYAVHVLLYRMLNDNAEAHEVLCMRCSLIPLGEGLFCGVGGGGTECCPR